MREDIDSSPGFSLLFQNFRVCVSDIQEDVERNIAKPEEKQEETEEEEELEKTVVLLQYCGKLTEKFEHVLKRIKAPCIVIMTL